MSVVARLTSNQVQALRAAQRGQLLRSVYNGYAWIEGQGRVSLTARRLELGQLIELLPCQPGDEHRGQPYKPTASGNDVLANQDKASKASSRG